MTKPMTAAALMMLVDERKVSLDDPVEKYLPEFKGQWVIAEQGKDHVLLKKPKRAARFATASATRAGCRSGSLLENPTIDKLLLKDAVRSYAITRCSTSRARSTFTRTRASTPPGASSKW